VREFDLQLHLLVAHLLDLQLHFTSSSSAAGAAALRVVMGVNGTPGTVDTVQPWSTGSTSSCISAPEQAHFLLMKDARRMCCTRAALVGGSFSLSANTLQKRCHRVPESELIGVSDLQ
jgi:hypothetical protein